MSFLDQAGNPIDWREIRGAIFDVDGTLYHQRPVRLRMAARMGLWFLSHPWRLRELKGILEFRQLRETERFRTESCDAQIRAAAERSGIRRTERLGEAIRRWMFREPLGAIAAHGRAEVLDLLRELQASGKRILIYSDYAPEEKLTALGVRADGLYYPGFGGITELKPSGKSVRLILEKEGLAPEEAVYLGDRPEKDGVSAADAGVRYIQVKRSGKA